MRARRASRNDDDDDASQTVAGRDKGPRRLLRNGETPKRLQRSKAMKLAAALGASSGVAGDLTAAATTSTAGGVAASSAIVKRAAERARKAQQQRLKRAATRTGARSDAAKPNTSKASNKASNNSSNDNDNADDDAAPKKAPIAVRLSDSDSLDELQRASSSICRRRRRLDSMTSCGRCLCQYRSRRHVARATSAQSTQDARAADSVDDAASVAISRIECLEFDR